MKTRYDIFSEELQKLSDQQLVDRFNGDVNNPGWVGARGDFHVAMRNEFDRRGFDYSSIGNQNQLSWAFRIGVEGRTILRV